VRDADNLRSGADGEEYFGRTRQQTNDFHGVKGNIRPWEG
jgi:hypothetical protein